MTAPGSVKAGKFGGEIGLHFKGIEGLNKPMRILFSPK